MTVSMDSSDWIRKVVLERELADIESRISRTEYTDSVDMDSEEYLMNCYVCEYIREQLKEMS